MKKIGIGIVGCGGIANAKHIPNLLKDDRVEIRGICESFVPERAAEAREKFALSACGICEDIGELLSRADIDVIHICTPNQGHAPLTIRALEAGKHVLCEKPMATNVAEAEDMVAAAKRTGKKLTIAANNRFRADSWYLKQLCREGALGEIYYAKAHSLRRRGAPAWGSFFSMEAQGGGPVIDLGTHSLDLALWMMDDYAPRTVFGKTYNHLGKRTSPANPYGNWRAEDFEVEDFGVGMIAMESGATVLLEASWLLNSRDEGRSAKVTLCGTKAGADMEDGLTINGEENGRVYDRKIVLDPPTIPFYGIQDAYGPALEIRTWIDAVANDTDPVVLPEQMLVVMKIVEAIYRSAEAGQPVHF